MGENLYCSDCVHKDVCGLEGLLDEGLTFCASKMLSRPTQEPFIKKSCISEKVCEHDKQMVLDKIKGYIDHIRNTGMGKEKSLEFIQKFIDGLKAESEE